MARPFAFLVISLGVLVASRAAAQDPWQVAADREVAAQIEQQRAPLARCHAQARAAGVRDPGQALDLHVEVAPAGTVQRATLAGGEAPRTARDRCVVRALLRFRFPAHDRAGVRTVDFSLRFERGGRPVPMATVLILGALGSSDVGPRAPYVRGRVVPVLAEMEIDGDLDLAVARRQIASHVSALQTCYERALRGRRDLAGRVTVLMTIGANGSITELRVDQETLGDEPAVRCIEGALRRVRFPGNPAAGGPITIRVPFDFTPRD